METTNKNIQIGCVTPLSVIVFLAFFFAKIYDKIDWSWWWVFSPLWIPIAIILIILLILGLIYLIALIISLWKL